MCGIAGKLKLGTKAPVQPEEIQDMLGMIRHRGPDEFGIYLDGPVGLGNARLSIIDLSGGQQPISNEDGTLWIVFNGEIFNYVELKPELEALGHRFATSSDTEVLLHMFEQYGPRCLERLNGQFAFAVWNVREQSLFLARDRLGVRPLFYTKAAGDLIFASEIKAILADRRVTAEIDPLVVDEVFTYWSALSPRTAFRNILEVPPGHYVSITREKMEVAPYWELDFSPPGTENQEDMAAYEQELSELLIDAAKIRLRADVPVGAYLSGGLDSSIIAAIIRNFTTNRLDTFSIAFDDASFDESAWQKQMAHFLGTDHQVVRASYTDIGKVFPEVVWHAETPLTRTAPAPMFLLSKLVRDSGYKVVLTGEGADEFLAGYDLFKEAKIRRFWAAQPDSKLRPLLLQKLYPDISELSKSNSAFLAAFFRENLMDVQAPQYSHAVRWRNGRRNRRVLSDRVQAELQSQENGSLAGRLPARFNEWDALARAQYLEITVFLSHYLLSSQGDRMGMAHSIEGRFPFLDFRVVNFCNRLPSRLKLRGLTEKYLLKRIGKKWLPPQIWQRPKRPYRAPIHRSFFGGTPPAYVRELLSPEKIAESDLFKPAAVNQLVRKIDQGSAIGEAGDMALAGILSTQLLHARFVSGFPKSSAALNPAKIKIRRACQVESASGVASR
ncbi:MAG TPA: asparagine synthase (glutamine-hydrolyzing) [Verrucomicrobiae bacterium]|nr:asparagine synthase (glutamine-hydrolyzing) [Verrucomicrobiae bacterium]